MEPAIKPLDKLLFYKYFDKATHYMEFGSTYQASIRPNIKSICTVEPDLEWIQILKSKIVYSSIQYNYIDIQALPKNLGYPGKDCSLIDMKKYSNVKVPSNTDLVLIDGRFRVACCLKVFNQVNDKCFIAFDDFLDRKYYHIVLEYYDIIEKTENNSLVILRKKECNLPSSELIAKYEVISQ